MKILAFADLHSKHGSPEYVDFYTSLKYIKKLKKLAKKEKPDVILFAGDASLFENHLEELMEKISKIGKNILVIQGNHETAAVMRKICAFHDNLKFIHKKTAKIGDYTFVGFSGEGFLRTDKEMEKFLKKIKPKIKGKKVVLITHAPPYNTKLDKIGKEHCGNNTITKFIKSNKNIILGICGHIHETAGKKDKINNATIINPGPLGVIIEI
ncbi:metallophosphoesterase family protein [Candidatus Woesearchaeota archaeon]|nr:metallophosphoesterase family protein [Candidatus Woesearchaeota archaeon]MBW3005176.1 metallophosphoesterase family protein [Candidatus Woesearchaeota archaeon]